MGEHKKAFWIIGIALIIFLILLLGSIIGLYLVRQGIDDALVNNGYLSGDVQEIILNYTELEDGTKENISRDIRDAEFDIDGIKLSHFSIQTSPEGICTITADIENHTDEVVENKAFLIVLKDANEDVIAEFTMDIEDLMAQTPLITVKSLVIDCSNAATIEVQEFGADNGEIVDIEAPSGEVEIISSGDTVIAE